MHVQIDRLEDLLRHLGEEGDLRGVVVQGLDLTSQTEALRGVSAEGAVLLGCTLAPAVAESMRASGAMLFPPLGEDRPYQPYRGRLYSAEELLEGMDPDRPETFWRLSRDARIYAWYEARLHQDSLLEALAQRLHDHAIDEAKQQLLASGGRRPVAIMGGHAMRRDEPAYRTVVAIARRLAQTGYFLVSGGGPGAMEATHLGAWLSTHPDDAIDRALEVLRRAPEYKDAGWHASAMEVKRAYPSDVESLAVPTWFYGHEPTNLFATHVAKYFSNSLREDGLLAIATHGVIFARGSAGTVQEVFMDACQNHYGTMEVVSPMVFLGVDYWREERPVKALLESLSGGRQYAERIAYVDEVGAAVRFIEDHPPVDYEK
ncbi:MAG: LOG family protein [Sandaracinaceae bacterium]